MGKPTGNDIKEGKITLPLIYALKNAPASESDEMKQLIASQEYSDKNIDRLLQFAKEQGGVDYAYEKMDKLLAEGEVIISGLPFNEEYKSLLLMFLAYLKERSY